MCLHNVKTCWKDSHCSIEVESCLFVVLAALPLATEMEDANTDQNTRKPLLSGWQLNSERDASSLLVTVEVNLARLQSRLDSPNDASFEVECLSDAIVGMSSLGRFKFDFRACTKTA